jgi:hypothetical protein
MVYLIKSLGICFSHTIIFPCIQGNKLSMDIF